MATAQAELEPFLEQEPFLYDEHRYYGYLSGVGSGKTSVGVMRDALNMEMWNAGHMGAIVAPTTQMIKNAILPLMRDFGLMERWDYNSPQSEEPGIVSPNGSRAVILSADNDRQIERLASLNLAWFHVDESRDVPERARQILIQRLRQGDYTNGYFTSTPRGENHDYDFFVGNQDPDVREHGLGTVYECDDRLLIGSVPTGANPHLDPDDVAAIRDAHPSGLLQQEVEGNFVEIGGGLLTQDMLSFVDPDTIPEEREFSWYVGVDIGVEADADKARAEDSDYWAAALVAHDGVKSTAYLVDVSRQRGLSLQQGVTWLASILDGVPTTRVLAEANQAQRWFVQAAKDAGLSVSPVNNTTPKEDRILYMSVPFENGKVKLFDHRDWSDFIASWVAFPEGRHDDQLDAVEIALQNVSLGGGVHAYGGNAYGDGE